MSPSSSTINASFWICGITAPKPESRPAIQPSKVTKSWYFDQSLHKQVSIKIPLHSSSSCQNWAYLRMVFCGGHWEGLRGGLHDKKGSWLSTLRQFWLDYVDSQPALRPKKCWSVVSRCAGSRHFCSCTGSSPENQDILPWNHSCARQILSGKHGNHNVAHWALLKATPVSLSIFLDHTASKLLLIATANVLAAQKQQLQGLQKWPKFWAEILRQHVAKLLVPASVHTKHVSKP